MPVVYCFFTQLYFRDNTPNFVASVNNRSDQDVGGNNITGAHFLSGVKNNKAVANVINTSFVAGVNDNFAQKGAANLSIFEKI